MAQVTSGLRAVLSHPAIYMAVQNIMGGKSAYQRFVREYIRPEPGMKILDIGCGPAAILDYLPDVDYYGFDISDTYIRAARERFGERGHFHCQLLTEEKLSSLPSFDLVMGLGLLHHLDDAFATEFFNLAYMALKPEGRLITIDPCFEKGQSPIARMIIKMDRGQNVRTRAGYDLLASGRFSTRSVMVRHTTWIPYTHCIMECIR